MWNNCEDFNHSESTHMLKKVHLILISLKSGNTFPWLEYNLFIYIEQNETDNKFCSGTRQTTRESPLDGKAEQYSLTCLLPGRLYIATTQPTTQKNLKQLLLGWYYYFQMKYGLIFLSQIEDDLNLIQIKVDLNILVNGRQPQKIIM